MKTTNPRYLVESILEDVDDVDERLDQALDERIAQYRTEETRGPDAGILLRLMA
jgi:hypothetical protein